MITFDRLVSIFHKKLEELPEHRKGGNNQKYSLKDAALSAFGVFFTQSPSFLAYQRQMEAAKGRSNAASLFKIEQTPSDPQIRNLLDKVNPVDLYPIYTELFDLLETEGVLSPFRDVNDTYLVAIDGIEFFSSKKVHCEQCYQRELSNGTIQYSHTALTPVLVKPDCSQVLPLPPEFILPQDGQEKQDSETAAAKRWLKKWGEFYAPYQMTVLGDDLYARQPLCKTLLAEKFNFILTCKPTSHITLYQELDALAPGPTVTELRWNGRCREIWQYRYMNQLPLRASDDALAVNWCELIITRESDGKRLFHNSWITNFLLDDQTVKPVTQAGRSRWKVENENNNVLKNHGYHFEHNFGHGSQFLSLVLLTLNLLAFFFHTILHLIDEKYRLLRQHLVVRQGFFNDLKTLTRYFYFDSWQHLLDFMISQLELDFEPSPT